MKLPSLQLLVNSPPNRMSQLNRFQIVTLLQAPESQCFCRGPAGAQLPETTGDYRLITDPTGGPKRADSRFSHCHRVQVGEVDGRGGSPFFASIVVLCFLCLFKPVCFADIERFPGDTPNVILVCDFSVTITFSLAIIVNFKQRSSLERAQPHQVR